MGNVYIMNGFMEAWHCGLNTVEQLKSVVQTVCENGNHPARKSIDELEIDVLG